MKMAMARRLHVSWHIAWASLGVVAGAAASPLAPPGMADAAWLVIACSLLLFVFIRRNAALVIAALAAGVMIGAWRGGLERSALTGYQPYIGQTVTLAGAVAEDASYGSGGDMRLRLNAVSINGEQLTGEVWTSLSSNPDIKRGDYVELAGRLSKGFGNIPAAMYRAQVTSISRPNPGDVARRVRDRFAEATRQAIPGPEASLGLGFLTGQKQQLPEQLAEQIRIVGLTHVVVASGFNLTILVNFARKAFMRLSKFLAALVGGLMTGGFMLVTGFTPSMSRAGLVAGLSLLAWYYGRAFQPVVLLSLAAAVTVLINPAYAWGDIGWCLSFAAFAGVIILAPLAQHYFWGTKRPSLIRDLLVTTVAAQLITLPIIAAVFHQYSPYSLLANLLVVPLVPLAMLLTFIAGLAGLLLPPLAEWLGWPAAIVLRYCVRAIEWAARLPGAASEVNLEQAAVFASYALILLTALALWRKTKHDFRNSTQNQDII